MRKIFLLIVLSSIIFAAKIEILQSLNLNDTKFNIKFNEISGATYDSKNGLLYMISDNGVLYKFKASFDDCVHLTPIKAYYLKDKNGNILEKVDRDSEDIALDSNGNLYISLERFPKISEFSKEGIKKRDLTLPKTLQNIDYRTNNKMFESLTFNSKYGLLTAIENPPYGIPRDKQKIYSLGGKTWDYNTTKMKKSSITAIESVDEDNILVLERAFDGFFGHHAISLQLFNLKSKKQEIIWQIDNYKFDIIENYEAIAKVGKNRFILISDDNKLPIFNTKLIYFELKD